jgi:hypothetical protein
MSELDLAQKQLRTAELQVHTSQYSRQSFRLDENFRYIEYSTNENWESTICIAYIEGDKTYIRGGSANLTGIQLYNNWSQNSKQEYVSFANNGAWTSYNTITLNFPDNVAAWNINTRIGIAISAAKLIFYVDGVKLSTIDFQAQASPFTLANKDVYLIASGFNNVTPGGYYNIYRDPSTWTKNTDNYTVDILGGYKELSTKYLKQY